VYEPRTGTNLGAIFLPGLTAPIHENPKIQYENEILKAKEPTPVQMSDLSNDTKKHTTKSRETIP
jgi:hypothetical protein